MIPEVRPSRNKIDENMLMRQFGIGRYGAGNIDLFNRPRYMNPDGSVSTVYSMSFGTDDGEVLVPKIAYNPQNGMPTILSDDDAINRYYRTGEHLGIFKTPEDAQEYAKRLHNQQAAIYR